MHLVYLVIGLALAQFIFFGVLVGRARGQYGVAAPATSGHEIFDRHFRVQMNTLELLVVLVPALLLFAHYFGANYAAFLGAIYLVGRFVFASSYVKDPKGRSLGFGLSMMPILVLVIGTLVGAVRALF